MNRRFIAIPRVCIIALLAASALTACDVPGLSSSAPTATPAPTNGNLPAGWQVYQGARFTIAYPPGWTYNLESSAGGYQSQGVAFDGPAAGDHLTIVEEYGFTAPDIQSLCTVGQGQSRVTMAGLPMIYAVVEGIHRTWYFMTSQRYGYALDADDGLQSAANQRQHDAILATFKPSDTALGCP